MAEYEFNPDLDKITEREMVRDIYARLSLGAPILDPDNDEQTVELFPSTTSVLELNSKIISVLPHSLIENLPKLEVYVHTITSGRAVNMNIYFTKKYVLVKAYLENNMTDISSLISITYEGSGTRIKFTTDTAFTNSDVLKLYLYVE